MSEPTIMSIKGRVTIPRDVRESLGLQAGDKVTWSLLSTGTVVVRPEGVPVMPAAELQKLAGIAKGARKVRYRDRKDRY